MKKVLKKSFKFLLYFILSFICFVLLYLVTAYGLSRITVNKHALSGNEITIYIKTNGVHTDIVVPVKTEQMDWSREIKYSNTQLTDTSAQWLAMGWGDKGFYLQTPTWADLKASVAFRAAFGLSTTAIHATFYNSLKEDSTCKKIVISKAQYGKLIAYIEKSYQNNADGHKLHIVTNANYGKADAFYEANGSYSMFHTCNTWANNALKACGQKACAWTAFDTGIFLKYQ